MSDKQHTGDAVTSAIGQWCIEGFLPDTLVAMETIGRIKRLEIMFMRHLVSYHKQQYGLNLWEFDVLATLRRSGKPYRLSPTALFASMMVSSGTMTNRLQHLEKKSLIKRVDNPEDKRSLLVQLTEKGAVIINEAVRAHIELENTLLKEMSREELTVVNMLLKKIEHQLPEC